MQKRFSILLASATLMSLLTIAPAFSARAADVSYGPGYQTEAALSYTEEERAELRASAANLHLSETNLNFKCGDILRIYVEPVELAKTQGWEIDKIEFSDPSALRMLPVDDPEVQSKKQELTDAIIASDITRIGDIDEGLLVVYFKAEKDGQSNVTVSVKNPAIGALVKMVCYATTPGYTPTPSTISSYSSNSGSRNPATTNPGNQNGSDTGNNETNTPSKPENPGTDSQPGDSTEKPGDGTEEKPGITDPGKDPETPDEGPDDTTNPGQPTDPDGPGRPTEPENPDTPDIPEIPDVPDVPEIPDDGELKDYDTSAWKWDESSLVFTYDGQPHFPTLLGVDDSIELIFGEAGINAGQYTYTVGVKTPEGFNPIPDFTISYEIEPAIPELEYVHNPETGEVEVQLKNVVPGDITVNSVTETPSGAETVASDPGLYQITTTFDVDADKAENYILPETPKNEYLNVKNENSWFDFGLSYSEKDGQLLLHVTIDNSVLPEYNSDLITSLQVFYDQDRLSYAGQETGDWDVMANDSKDGVQEIIASHEGVEITDSVIVTLKFDYKTSDNKDLLFYTGIYGDKDDPRDMIQIMENENKDLYLITYNTGSLPSLIVNPEETQVKDVIIENNDLMEDVIIESGIKDETAKNELEEKIREDLEDYIENGFELPDSDLETPVDPSNPDENIPDLPLPGESEKPNPDTSEETGTKPATPDVSEQPDQSLPPAVGGGENNIDTTIDTEVETSTDETLTNSFETDASGTHTDDQASQIESVTPELPEVDASNPATSVEDTNSDAQSGNDQQNPSQTEESSTQSVATEATTTPSVSDANTSSTPSVSDTAASSDANASAAPVASESNGVATTSSSAELAEAA